MTQKQSKVTSFLNGKTLLYVRYRTVLSTVDYCSYDTETAVTVTTAEWLRRVKCYVPYGTCVRYLYDTCISYRYIQVRYIHTVQMIRVPGWED